MLVRITNYCDMACTHCFTNATPQGGHMTLETFEKTLKFLQTYDPHFILLSGGEPTDHPNFLEFAEMAIARIPLVLVISNGMFTAKPEYMQKILSLDLQIQITNDPRYYPTPVKTVDHPKIVYEHNIRALVKLGRAKSGGMKGTRYSPMCFNARSVSHHYSTLEAALFELRSRGKMCSPSVNVNGSIVAGEAPECGKVGTVESSGDEILQGMRRAPPNNCDAEKNLTGVPLQVWNEWKAG